VTPDERCALSRGTVEHTGDVLPSGFVFRCPDTTYPHWGVTSGASGQPHFIAVNLNRIGPDDAKLRYVIAHENCHARAAVGLENYAWTDEEATDRCAADYGFPNVYFARSGPEFGTTIQHVDQPDTSTPVVIGGLVALVIVAALLVAYAVRRRPTVVVIHDE
jgi:hypothetical protein